MPRCQDVSAEQSLKLPELYIVGQKDELFNYWVFLQAVAHGMGTSLVNFFMTLWVCRDSGGPVIFGDYQSFAEVVALSGLLSVTMEVRGPRTRAAEVSPPGEPALCGPRGAQPSPSSTEPSPGVPARPCLPLAPRAGHPHPQILDRPVCAGHSPQPLFVHTHDLGQPELLALQTLPQDLPVSV